jgi:hypothetical protein
MSNTQTTLNLDQARLFGALAQRPNGPVDLEYGQLIDVLDALPNYTEFVLEIVDGNRNTQWRLMARDIPRPGRRYTNLDSGMEWMDLNGVIANNQDVYGISVRTQVNGEMLAMAGIER